MCHTQRRHGFSLIELVIVVVLIGIISAIAIPRLGRATRNAQWSAVTADYTVLNKALAHYAAEHGGKHPSAAHIVDALTKYSDFQGGNFADAEDSAQGIIYGPYIRKIPTVSIGPNEGETGIGMTNSPGIGWYYFESQGVIYPNLLDDGNSIPSDILEDMYVMFNNS